MHIPKCRRITVATAAELHIWLRKNAGQPQDVMIVTRNRTSPTKHISSAEVRAAALESGWTPGRSYTLAGGLSGHVVRHD